MFTTLRASGGVGLVGPQIGILRRIVAVKRFDKDGQPVCIYPSIKILSITGENIPSSEGCLSVPQDEDGDVLRSQNIDISYTSPETLKDTIETIKGFTAIIFQHECDHLNGVIYIDKNDY